MVLRVTVGVDGGVSDVEVAEPAGYGFDEAAQLAALGHRFEPARRDGQPVAARVLLRLVFRAPEPQLAPSAPPVAETPPAAEPPAAASSAPAVAAPPPSSGGAGPVEISVRGRTVAERLRRSAAAVHVVETQDAKRRTADLGEVLARTQGVGVQRTGGLGSDTRVSLNGLTDDQIRFFVDGIPLAFMGFPFGLANVPVNLVRRVEIYRGVVPARFGADALGGAVNLVSDQELEAGTHAAASIQGGSFGTYRVTLSTHHLDEPSGWLTRVGAFMDRADNDYPMDVDVAGPTGQEQSARVYRFHDAYQARGASIETGVVDQPWARRLLLRGFVTRYDKEIQHNLLMTFNPYGDVELGELSAGGTLRYVSALGRGLLLDAVAGYAYRSTEYSDVGECVYDWFGQCLRERGQPGERLGRAQEQDYWEHALYARANLEWAWAPRQALRLSLSPSYTSRSGTEHRRASTAARDPLSAERDLYGLVSGLEHELRAFEARLENVVFAKSYLQVLRSEDPLSGGDGFRRRDRATHHVGLGDAVRFAFTDAVYAKFSYERATRLPRADEIFGDAFPIQPNLELRPELSHNLNLSLTLAGLETPVGQLRADVNGFVRDTDQLIVLVGDDQSASYQNVYSARAAGVEGAVGWTSPGEYVALDGNSTYVDFRNTSTSGGFAGHAGSRLPNRPYLFANAEARLQGRGVAAPRDRLALSWSSRYVHPFYRAWEGLGADKLRVPAQLVHALGLTYTIVGDPAELSFTGEAQNLTDARAFDVFGVPKPGRAFNFKATASL